MFLCSLVRFFACSFVCLFVLSLVFLFVPFSDDEYRHKGNYVILLYFLWLKLQTIFFLPANILGHTKSFPVKRTSKCGGGVRKFSLDQPQVSKSLGPDMWGMD